MTRARRATHSAAAVVALTVAALALTPPPPAAGQAPCRNVAIRSPVTGEVVTGTVPVLGSAQIDGFQFYKIEWAPVGEPDTWRAVSDIRREAVINGLLDQWNTAPVPDGTYRLKLTVVDQAAVEVCRAVVEDVVVGGLAALGTTTATASPTLTAETPTDEPTEEPEAAPATAEATPEAAGGEAAGATAAATLAPIVPVGDEAPSETAVVSAGGLATAFGGGFCLAFLVAALLVLLFGRRGGR